MNFTNSPTPQLTGVQAGTWLAGSPPAGKLVPELGDSVTVSQEFWSWETKLAGSVTAAGPL